MVADVLNALEKRHESHVNSIYDAAQQEANKHIEHLMNDYQAHLNDKEKELQRKGRTYHKRRTSRIVRENKLRLDHIKSDLVESLLLESKAYFETLSSDLFCDLIDGALSHNVSDIKPRIFVESRHVEAARSRFGLEYQVIDANLLKSGFVLSFETYDVNFDFEEIFKFRYDALSRRAMELLFGDDTHV